MIPGYVTLTDAARELGVSTATLRRWVKRGHVPALLVPTAGRGTYLVKVEDLEEARHHVKEASYTQKRWEE